MVITLFHHFLKLADHTVDIFRINGMLDETVAEMCIIYLAGKDQETMTKKEFDEVERVLRYTKKPTQYS